MIKTGKYLVIYNSDKSKVVKTGNVSVTSYNPDFWTVEEFDTEEQQLIRYNELI